MQAPVGLARDWDYFSQPVTHAESLGTAALGSNCSHPGCRVDAGWAELPAMKKPTFRRFGNEPVRLGKEMGVEMRQAEQ